MTRFTLAEVRERIVTCERCPRLRDVLPADRPREAPRLSRRDLLGAAGAGLRRSARAPADCRPRAGRARRQSHRTRLHRRRRRRIRRLSDGGAAPRRLREPHDLAAPRRWPAADDAYIVAAVRCAPPDNKPTPEEIARCLPHLEAELAALPRVRVVVALGRIAFDAYLQSARASRRDLRAQAAIRARIDRAAAERHDAARRYHPSRQNTNTGRLTPTMLAHVFATAARIIRRVR